MKLYSTSILVILTIVGTAQVDVKAEEEKSSDTITFKTNNKIIKVWQSDSISKTTWEVTPRDEASFKEIDDEKDREKSVNTHINFDIGMAGYALDGNYFKMPKQYRDFDLDLSRSRQIAFNILFREIDFVQNRLYFITGFGFDFKNYHFKNPVLLGTSSDTLAFELDSVNSYSKNKLCVRYFQIPLLFGVKLGELGKRNLTLQAGATLGYKIYSRASQDLTTPKNEEVERKVKDDFNLSPFRAALTARLGYGGVGIFVNYALTPMFNSGLDPKLNAFSVGLTFGGF